MSASPDIIFAARDVAVGYRHDRPLLENITFDLWSGTLTTLLGANGRGKSTLLRVITGEQRPLCGTVTIDGADVAGLGVARRARLVSIVNTDRHVGGSLTVSELVAMGRYPYTGFFGRLSAEDRRICEYAIETVGVGVSGARYVSTLSDGERQKVMIARAIAQQTPLIVLDEPTAFLDAASRIETIQLLHRLTREHHRTVLLSTHDVPPAVRFSDRMLLAMPDRQLIGGTPGELAADPHGLPALFAGRPVCYDPASADFTVE